MVSVVGLEVILLQSELKMFHSAGAGFLEVVGGELL
jgi:hypothetical protein